MANSSTVINWIHSYKAYGRRPKLERMTYFLNLLGNPQNHIKAIHIVGTNGKGSTTAYLQHIFLTAGYQVGTFTSPYISPLMNGLLSMALLLVIMTLLIWYICYNLLLRLKNILKSLANQLNLKS